MELTTLKPNLCRKMVIMDCDLYAIEHHTCEPFSNEFEPVPSQSYQHTTSHSPFSNKSNHCPRHVITFEIAQKALKLNVFEGQ